MRSRGFTAEERRVARRGSLARYFYCPRITRITRIGSLTLTVYLAKARKRERFACAIFYCPRITQIYTNWFANAHRDCSQKRKNAKCKLRYRRSMLSLASKMLIYRRRKPKLQRRLTAHWRLETAPCPMQNFVIDLYRLYGPTCRGGMKL